MVYIRPTDGAELKLNNKQANILDDLEDSALSRTNESPTGRILWSVGIFVLAVGPLGLYIAGLAASPMIVSAVKKALKNGQQAIYLRKSGNFAHLLKESELVQLTQAIGKESVAHQLMEAHQDGHTLTNAAQRYLKLSGHQVERLTLDTLFSEPASAPVDVPATVVATAPNEARQPVAVNSRSMAAEWGTATTETQESDTALSRLLASPYQSRAIFGGQRTGKSNLVAIASSRLAKKGTAIYHINLLSYTGKGNEDKQYTAHCKQSICADFSHLADSNQRQVKVSKAIEMVNAWWTDDSAILIFDEFAYAASVAVPETAPLLALIADKLAAIASSGMKREHALWALSPSMVASELQDAGKRVKSLAPVMVAIAPGHTEQWQGQELTFDSSLHSEVNRNFGNVVSYPTPAMVPGRSRIAYINGGWCRLGTEGLKLEVINSNVDVDNVSEVALKQVSWQKLIDEVAAVNKPVSKVIAYLSKKNGETISYRALTKASAFTTAIKGSDQTAQGIVAILVDKSILTVTDSHTEMSLTKSDFVVSLPTK